MRHRFQPLNGCLIALGAEKTPEGSLAPLAIIQETLRSGWQSECISHQVPAEMVAAIISESNSGHSYREEVVGWYLLNVPSNTCHHFP